MVTASQLQILQSPITSLISTLSTSVNVKLDDSNYLNWHFQMELLLESNGIMGFVDGSTPCPARVDESGTDSDAYTVWKLHDRALMQLVTATLSPVAMSCAIGSSSSRDLWTRLKEQFSTYNTFRTVVRGRESVMTIKEFRSQLLAEETIVDSHSTVPFLSAMVVTNSSAIDTTLLGQCIILNPMSCLHLLLVSLALFLTCQLCNAEGHTAPYCSNKSSDRQQCQICGKFNHTTWYCFYNEKGPSYMGPQFSQRAGAPMQGYSYNSPPVFTGSQPSSLQAMHTVFSPSSQPSHMGSVASTSQSPQVWLTDSGATTHMTADLNNLSIASPYPSNEVVQTANGEGQGHRENHVQGPLQ
ncbi:cation/H(+) antiporter 15-like [Pyrus ussuriensis x Pyrus communis]|uniref:Cation/H(+) antiporter 15-like n=1 Tax=Pyrus ussuriensis x Pyrus communis TaxID=2448454 RepID=A0A5N5I342_9ROSA|nr:cation/H(+) antiporter 15-like [Pyrus ussuriensis x Pyrus communis]